MLAIPTNKTLSYMQRNTLPLRDVSRQAVEAEEIMQLIPHRAPFLLIDRVIDLDLAGGTVHAERIAATDDPVFAGHFPGHPVYPAVLQCEAIGQAGVFLANAGARARKEDCGTVLVTRIRGAVFGGAVSPGDVMTIAAAILDEDALVVTIAGQLHVGDRFCSAAVFEGMRADG